MVAPLVSMPRCSGRKSNRFWVPSRYPFPVSPPEPIATFDWMIDGTGGSSSYDTTQTTTGPATVQQTDNFSFGQRQTFAFSYACSTAVVGSFCVPSPAGVNLLSIEPPAVADTIFASKDVLLGNVLQPAASDLANYETDVDPINGYSWLRIGGDRIAISSIAWSEVTVTDPDPDPNVVPLPAGLPLILTGLGVLAVLRRRA